MSEKPNPLGSRRFILIMGLTVLALVAGYAYYTTQQYLIEQSEKGKVISTEVVARELAGLAIDFLKKTFEKYKGG